MAMDAGARVASQAASETIAIAGVAAEDADGAGGQVAEDFPNPNSSPPAMLARPVLQRSRNLRLKLLRSLAKNHPLGHPPA